MLENNRPGVAARLGVDYETVREVNPRLVYASISGFGQTGPYSQRPGYDLIAQGLAGVMSVTGEPDGNPVKCGIPIGDLSSGLFCAVAILSRAARARAHGPRPVHRHVAVRGRAGALDLGDRGAVGDRARAGQARLRAPADRAVPGAARPPTATSRWAATRSRCSSGCAASSGRDDLPSDPRFATNDDRMANVSELVEELESALAARGTDEWVAALVEGGVPCGPIHDYAEVFADEHTQAREMEVSVEHPVEGTIRALGIPVKLSDTPGAVRRPAPLLGQHTEEILREAGFDEEEIRSLS